MDRVTVEQAARILGIKEESVRKRVSRGKLRSDKDEDGRLLVYVDAMGKVRDESRDKSVTTDNQLVDTLRDQVAYLRDVIATRDEEIRRRDVIISQLTSRIPEIEAPASSEPPEAPTEATEQPGRVEPQPSVEGTQEGAEPRSWWRRVFGG